MNPKNEPAGLENLFLVPIFVLSLTMQHRHHKGMHANPAAALFELAVIVFCGVGYVVALVMKHNRQQQAPGLSNSSMINGISPNLETVVMAIPYSSQRSEVFRCLWYSSLRSPGSLFLLFGIAPAVGFFIALSNHGISPIGVLVTNGLVATALFYVTLFVLSALAISSLYPSGKSVRTSTIALATEGLYDIMPSRTSFIPWPKIRSIVVSGADIYFFNKSGCNYCPNVMTNTPNEGRILVETANELWKGRTITNSNLPIIFPASPQMSNSVPPPNWQQSQGQGIWPPPPSPGWQQQQWPQPPQQPDQWTSQTPQQYTPSPPETPQQGSWPPQPPA